MTKEDKEILGKQWIDEGYIFIFLENERSVWNIYIYMQSRRYLMFWY